MSDKRAKTEFKQYTLYSPVENDIFSYNTYIGYSPIKNGFISLTPEQIEGLNNHTMCWSGYTVIPYTKTANDLAQETIANKIEHITMLKQRLSNTDYQAIKYAEGQISENDYAPIKAQRQAWRDEINELEKEIN